MKMHLQLSALFQYAAKDFMKNGLRVVLFCLGFALFAQYSNENCSGIVKKCATARDNRSRLIKVMPLQCRALFECLRDSSGDKERD